jgi:TPP-dependent indolepyruvate ferredoxin oxidoreductase alpha subunit
MSFVDAAARFGTGVRQRDDAGAQSGGVQDILDLGLLGWAMSRYTGRWVGFKTIAETVESSASVDVDPLALRSCCRKTSTSRAAA